MKGSLPHLAPALAILSAAAAQYIHTFFQTDWVALFFFATALGLWFVTMATGHAVVETRLDASISSPPRPNASARRTPNGLAIGAGLLALLTFFLSNDNQFTPDSVLAWGLSIVIFFYAFWEPEQSWMDRRVWLSERLASARAILLFGCAQGKAQDRSNGLRVPLRALALLALLLVAWFFYFHNLDGVPAEMTSDHAEKILDVNDVVNGARPIFFIRNTGREPLQFYLTAALVNLGHHPLDHMALKLVTATLGWLVVPFVYFFARELFEEKAAFLAALLIAVSKWPVTIARMGLRFPFTPVFIALLLFFLFRGLKYQRRNDFLMAGLFLGLGLYGYNASRLAPVLVVAYLCGWFLMNRRMGRIQTRRLVTNAVLLFALALVIFAPLLRYSLDSPENFWYRALTRLTGEEQPIAGNPALVFATNLVNATLMFNWTGDQAWPNSIPGDPALDYLSGGLFFLGVAYAVYRLVRFREQTYAFVLLGLGVMLLPSALSLAFPSENPSVVRAGGAIPFVFLVVALPLTWFARMLQQSWGRIAAYAVLVLFIAAIARVNYLRYFDDFDTSYRLASWNSSEVATAIRGFTHSVGDLDHVWIMTYPHWIDTRNVAIHLGRIGWDQTLPNADAAQPHANDGANKLYVLNPNDRANLARLQEIFPNGQLRTFFARTPGHAFLLWYVPGNIAPDALVGTK